MTTPSLTTKEKLAAVIARYRPEEDAFWHEGMRQTVMASDLVKDRFRLMGLVLHPAGMMAAYGSEMVPYGVSFHEPNKTFEDNSIVFSADGGADARLGMMIPGSDGAWVETPMWLAAAQEILHAWCSKPEGDAEAAINVAFSHLKQ